MKGLFNVISKEDARKSIYVGLERSSSEPIIRSESLFEGIEKYLYIRIEESNYGMGMIKMHPQMLSILELEEKEAWEIAQRNSNSESVIIPMWELFGLPGMTPEAYIITNKLRCRGASSIMNNEMIRKFVEAKNVEKIIVLPSSIHEMIVLPYDDSIDIIEFSQMVQGANEEVVEPEERLADKAFILDVKCERKEEW